MDVAAIERSTVEGVAPRKLLEIDGWLVPLDPGTTGRAKSAAPLSHDLDASAVDAIVDAYRARGNNTCEVGTIAEECGSGGIACRREPTRCNRTGRRRDGAGGCNPAVDGQRAGHRVARFFHPDVAGSPG